MGDKIPCGLVGEVIESKAADYPVGACIAGWANWEEYSVIASAGISKVLDLPAFIAEHHGGHALFYMYLNMYATYDSRVCHESQLDPKGLPLEGAMSVMNVIIGLTAWAGIREILGIPKGEGKDKVVCVSGASGAVGLVACQIAKADGAKVVGIAGKQPTRVDALLINSIFCCAAFFF